eukprot:159790_1
MPCQGVEYQFHTMNKASCHITYQYFSSNAINETISFLIDNDYMECYSIYVHELSSFTCIGTKEPTYDPTMNPTTTNPTIDPTYSPTPLPTRVPTVSSSYDSFFVIHFLISNFQTDDIYHLIDNPVNVTNKIVGIIETAYVEETSLRYQYFWVEIHNILDYKIQNINENGARFLQSKKRITLNSTIKCDHAVCAILLTYSQQPFILNAQNRLRFYFTNDNLTFSIADRTEDIAIMSLYAEKEYFWEDPVFIASIIFIIFCGLMSMCSLMHSFEMCCCKYIGYPMDDPLWISFVVYGFQVFDMASDINLSKEMIENENFKQDLIITVCGIASVVFIVFPYGINIFYALRIGKYTTKNVEASSYFKHRFVTLVTLVILSGGCLPSLSVVSSGFLGLNVFNSGLTRYEILQLSHIKIISTIVCENAPQFIIQCVYSAYLRHITNGTYLSFVASIASILIATLSYCFAKNDDNLTAYSYYIQILKMSPTAEDDHLCILTDDEKRNFRKNKGKTLALSIHIAEIFGIPQRNIEIARQSTIIDRGINMFVIHYVNTEATLDAKYLGRLYRGKHGQKIDNLLLKHFDLNKDQKSFAVKYLKYVSDGDEEKEEDENVTYDQQIRDKLKYLMEKRNLNYDTEEGRMMFFKAYMSSEESHDANTSSRAQMEMEPLPRDSSNIEEIVTIHDEVEKQLHGHYQNKGLVLGSGELKEGPDDVDETSSSVNESTRTGTEDFTYSRV